MNEVEQILSKPQMSILKSTAAINLFLAGTGCFHGDTLIRTDKGYVKIKDIQNGERVLTFNEALKIIEFKPVINKYSYKTGDIKQKCCIFVLNNNTKIICTDEHRFYFKGSWVAIRELAGRKMEADTRNEGQVLCEQYGQNINPKMAQRTYPGIYETGIGWKRLSENNDTQKWEVSHNKDAQRNCKSIYSQSSEQTDNKSYQRHKVGQSNRELRMGNVVGECISCVCNRVGEQCRGKSSKAQADRCDCITCETDEKRGDKVQGHCERTGIQRGGSERLLHPELVAREISIEEIKSFEFIDCPIVYDLEVKDNHNYCITEDNIIVHNSGKTFLGGVLSINFVSKFPDVRGAIFANTYDQLNTSTLFRIREYWASIGVTEWSKENPSGLYVSGKEPPATWTKCKRNFDRFTNIVSFANGGLIFTGSLDNYETHSGKEFAWCLLDETKDTKEEAVKEVIITRMRQPGMFIVDGKPSTKGDQHQQWNPLYCLTSPAKTDWLAEMFELDKYIDEISARIYSETDFFAKTFKDKHVVISSAYHNVHNVGENYIKSILANNTEERGRALVFGNPFMTLGGEFYSSFNRLQHVGLCRYDPSRPLHVSFDQNSVPYNSCSIWQFENKDGIWWSYCIDEIALENPRNSTEEVCDEILLKYAHHKSGLYYYGDASGKDRSTMNKEFKHHYQIVEFKLRRMLIAGSDRTLLKNPSIAKRRDFINRIFENKLPIRIVIDEHCKLMIADMMYVKQDINGAKDKHIVTDKETGDKYQKYGHLGDNMEYIICEVFSNHFNQ